MLSAIPWIGKDLVELIWGGVNYCTDNMFPNFMSQWLLIPIGKVPHQCKHFTEAEMKKFFTIPIGFLTILISLIDGDEYIAIVNSGRNFIKLELAIALDIRDLPLLKYIHETLSLGRLYHYISKEGIQTIKPIFNRTELQQVLFPLIIYHGIFF
jgi:hypothetical protein